MYKNFSHRKIIYGIVLEIYDFFMLCCDAQQTENAKCDNVVLYEKEFLI